MNHEMRMRGNRGQSEGNGDWGIEIGGWKKKGKDGRNQTKGIIR